MTLLHLWKVREKIEYADCHYDNTPTWQNPTLPKPIKSGRKYHQSLCSITIFISTALLCTYNKTRSFIPSVSYSEGSTT